MAGSSYITTGAVGAVTIARLVREKFTDHEAGIIRNEASAVAESSGWRLALGLTSVTFLTSAGNRLFTIRPDQASAVVAVA